MLNSNVYQEMINTGGRCMVLERTVLTDRRRILYCTLSDEYFCVRVMSITAEEELTNIFSWQLTWSEETDQLCIADKEDLIQCEVAGFDRIFTEMLVDWYKSK